MSSRIRSNLTHCEPSVRKRCVNSFQEAIQFGMHSLAPTPGINGWLPTECPHFGREIVLELCNFLKTLPFLLHFVWPFDHVEDPSAHGNVDYGEGDQCNVGQYQFGSLEGEIRKFGCEEDA